MSPPTMLSPGRIASLACLLEVAAPKPGNVHRGADFEDVGLVDFMVSAELLGATIDQKSNESLGEMILNVVEATRKHVGSNTNLGLALLLCPLGRSAQSFNRMDAEALSQVLLELTADDSRSVYAAIRLAQSGGMPTVERMDIQQEAPVHLIDAMTYASEWDMVARQYRDSFQNIFSDVVPLLKEGLKKFDGSSEAIVFAHVALLSRFPDSLIARKCGDPTALQAQAMAGRCLDALKFGIEGYWKAVGDLDFWMRADGHRRNPGTTADLIAAGLMVMLFDGELAFTRGRLQ